MPQDTYDPFCPWKAPPGALDVCICGVYLTLRVFFDKEKMNCDPWNQGGRGGKIRIKRSLEIEWTGEEVQEGEFPLPDVSQKIFCLLGEERDR